MAIKLSRPTFYKISAVKEFTGRQEPRKAFWERYAKMVSEGSTIISFYGAGGVGKTALLKKLEEEIKRRDELTGNECKYIKYNFTNGTDLREVLKTFKFQLSAYGCEFPMFDIGNYYYSLKIGQDINPPRATSMLEKIPWVQKMKKNLAKANNLAGKVMPTLNTTKMIFNAAGKGKNLAELFLKSTSNFVSKSMPVLRTMTTFMLIADVLLMKYMEHHKILDEDHEIVRNQLNFYRKERNPNALYEFLPTLFAMDVADWIKQSGNKLVVFLDNYESLISAINLATEEQLKRDLWLRGKQGLIFMIPDTLWTVAGRNKLCWDGDLADETEQHLIKALSPEDSDLFLKRAGIADETLRKGLVRLTEGYPIFLDLCVNVYVEYKRQHDNEEPTIDEFGQKREEVVARIFRYLDATGDDSAKDMLEFLCLLNVWTDEIAIEIGEKVMQNFSRNTYKRVKNFSCIQSENIINDDIDLKIYRFDKTIQDFLVADCDEKLIADVKATVTGYLKKFFADKSTFDAKKIFYLKLWANFIARLADNAETLQAQYEENVSDYVSALINRSEFEAAEEILYSFINRFETFGDTDTLPYIHFKLDLGWLKRIQGNYDEAYDITNSAYEKLNNLLGKTHHDTLYAMHNLAAILSDLGRYNEALALQEKVWASKRKLLGANHPETLYAMHNLGGTLYFLERYDEAFALQKKTLALQKMMLGENHPYTLDAMNNLAATLCKLGRFKDALILQKTVLEAYKEISGKDQTKMFNAADTMAYVLNGLKRYDEALELQRDTLAQCEENLGNEHPLTITVMKNLANILNDAGKHDEAALLIKKALKLAQKNLNEGHPLTKEILEFREKLLTG